MGEEFSPQLGIGRRQLLRRGAIVGGSLVWATPAVQSFARPAFAQNGTPKPDGDGALSYVALVLDPPNGGPNQRVKWEVGGGAQGGSWDSEPGKTPHCTPPVGWETAEPVNGAAVGIDVTGDAAHISFLLPMGYAFVAGVAMGAAGNDHPNDKGFCTQHDQPVTSEDGRVKVSFSDPNAS